MELYIDNFDLNTSTSTVEEGDTFNKSRVLITEILITCALDNNLITNK